MSDRKLVTCPSCGREHLKYKNGGTKCYPCVRKGTLELADKPLRDKWSNNIGYQQDIESAIELLTLLGYDVQGDVHRQFCDKWNARGYSIS